MIERSLATVAVAVDGRLGPGTDPAAVVDRVVTDSREAGPGALFVALPGEHADGHDHVDEALDAGATGVLSHRPTHERAGVVRVEDTWAALAALAGHVRRTVNPEVVAVTGSVGKTTTKDLVAAACRDARATVAAPNSFNNELGVPLTLLAAEHGTRVLVCEVGARGRGHIAGLMPVVRPDVAIVTAVAGVHLEMFGDLDTVAAAKAELVEGLGPYGAAVLNDDDPRVAAMAERHGGDVLRVGRAATGPEGRGRDLWASDVRLDALAQPSFTAHTPWGAVEVTVPLSGEHHVHNALLALAAAGRVGVRLDEAAGGITRAPVSPWRSAAEVVGGVTILDDSYNANPTSMRAGLAAARDIAAAGETRGRVVAVLGVMAEIGPSHDEEHVALGSELADLGVARLVVVGEGASGIADGARSAGLSDVTEVADVDEATAAVLGDLRPGDVVLCKGSRVAGLEVVAAHLRSWLVEEADR